MARRRAGRCCDWTLGSLYSALSCPESAWTGGLRASICERSGGVQRHRHWRQRERHEHQDGPYEQFGLRAKNEMKRHPMKRHLCFVAIWGICLFGSSAAAYAQVRADSGSIAIGGSVTGSTVVIGIPQEKVDELVRDAKRPLEDLTT